MILLRLSRAIIFLNLVYPAGIFPKRPGNRFPKEGWEGHQLRCYSIYYPPLRWIPFRIHRCGRFIWRCHRGPLNHSLIQPPFPAFFEALPLFWDYAPVFLITHVALLALSVFSLFQPSLLTFYLLSFTLLSEASLVFIIFTPLIIQFTHFLYAIIHINFINFIDFLPALILHFMNFLPALILHFVPPLNLHFLHPTLHLRIHRYLQSNFHLRFLPLIQWFFQYLIDSLYSLYYLDCYYNFYNHSFHFMHYFLNLGIISCQLLFLFHLLFDHCFIFLK